MRSDAHFFILLKIGEYCKISIMRKRNFIFAICAMLLPVAVDAAFTSCGSGYVLVEGRQKIDGVPVAECQKLWCRDLENGKMMGEGDKPNAGYQATSGAEELCDATGNCIECWGARKWCAGEARGEWNPEYGAYTRGGDNATYLSYQKSGCFSWRLEKPECEAGLTAILQDGKWVCASSAGTTEGSRASGVRRTGGMRRLSR